MTIYFIVLLFLLALSVLEFKVTMPSFFLKSILLIFTLFLSTLAAVRWETGQDFQAYLHIFHAMPSILGEGSISSGYTNVEPGFRVLASLSKAFGGPEYFYFLSCFVSLASFSVGLIRVNKIFRVGYFTPCFIYFCVFFINYNFNAMRQGIAMGFFIYALYDIYYNNTKRVLSVSIIATLFHSTGALIFLSFLCLKIIDFSKIKTLIFGSILCVLFFVLEPITRVLIFAGVDIARWQDSWGALDNISIIFRIVILVLLIFPKYPYLNDKFLSLMFNLYFQGFVIYFSLASVSMMATRFNMFYRILEIILIPGLIMLMNSRINKVILFILYGFISVYLLYTTGSEEVNLYKLNQSLF